MPQLAPAFGRMGNELADFSEWHNADDTAHGLTAGILAALAAAENPGATNPLLTIEHVQSGSVVEVPLFEITPANPYNETHGPFFFGVNNTEWPAGGPYTSVDPIMTIGYNSNGIGVKQEPDAATMVWRIEADYLQAGLHQLECYWQYANEDSSDVFRPLHFRVDDLATGACSLNLRSDVISLYQPSAVAAGDAAALLFADFAPQLFRVYGSSGGDTGFRIEAGSARSAHLYLGYNGVYNAIDIMSNNASQSKWYDHGVLALNFSSNVAGTSTGGIFYGVASPAGTLHVKSGHDSLYAGLFDARASQAVSILAIRDNAAAILSHFSKSGYFMTRKATVPADAELASGELSIWFDSTDGAGKLMVKAKTANGTVVTGSVALA